MDDIKWYDLKRIYFPIHPAPKGVYWQILPQGTVFFGTLPGENIRRIESLHRKHWKFINKIPASWEFPRPSGDAFLNAPLLSADYGYIEYVGNHAAAEMILFDVQHLLLNQLFLSPDSDEVCKCWPFVVLCSEKKTDRVKLIYLTRILIKWNRDIWATCFFSSDGDRCSVYYSPIHSIQTRETKIFVCWSYVFLKSSLQSWFEWSYLRMYIWSKLGPRRSQDVYLLSYEYLPNLQTFQCGIVIPDDHPLSLICTLHHILKIESTSSDTLLLALKRERRNTLEGASCK